MMKAGEGSVASRAKGEGIVRAGEGSATRRAKSEGSKKTPKFAVVFSSFNKHRNK